MYWMLSGWWTSSVLVSYDGISAVTAVSGFPRPTDLNALTEFLGLTLYNRRFLSSFLSVAQLLYSLTHKDVPFEGPDCEIAFEQLKSLLTNAPELAYP